MGIGKGFGRVGIGHAVQPEGLDRGIVAQQLHLENAHIAVRGDVGVNIVGAVAGFALLQGVDLVGLLVAQGGGRQTTHRDARVLHIGDLGRGGEGQTAGQETVHQMVAHNGAGHADIGQVQRRGGSHLHGIQVQDGQVRVMAGLKAADAIVELVLPGGQIRHAEHGLKRVDALVEIPELHPDRVLDRVALDHVPEFLEAVRAVDGGHALIQGAAGHGRLDAAQLVNGRDVRIIVEAVGLIVQDAPAHGTHISGAAGAHDLFHVRLAPEIGVVDVIGHENILGLHQARQRAVVASHLSGVKAAGLEGSLQVPVHVVAVRLDVLGGGGIVAGQALDELQFHHLAVDGGVPGVHMRAVIGGHGMFQGGCPVFGGGAAVGVGFGADPGFLVVVHEHGHFVDLAVQVAGADEIRACGHVGIIAAGAEIVIVVIVARFLEPG